MKSKTLTILALLGCFVVCSIALTDFRGKWSGQIIGLDGNSYTLTYFFKVDSNKLTGTAEFPEGTVSINDGKINGDDFTFNLNFDGEIIPHTGKCYRDSVAVDMIISDKKIHCVLKHDAK